jgi:lipopolysaccharide biosynthesis glycosyltransferase
MLSNSTDNEKLHIHILDCGISDNNIKNIESLKDSIRDFDLQRHIFDMKNIENLGLFCGAPITANVRAFIYKLFPELNKILLLDGDTIINSNIRELYEIEMKDKCIAGFKVSNPMSDSKLESLNDSELIKEITHNNKIERYNGGVLLYNFEQIRKKQLEPILDNYLEISRGINGYNFISANEFIPSLLRNYGKYDFGMRFNYRFFYTQQHNKENIVIVHYEDYSKKPWQSSKYEYINNKNSHGKKQVKERSTWYDLWHMYCGITPYAGGKNELNRKHK